MLKDEKTDLSTSKAVGQITGKRPDLWGKFTDIYSDIKAGFPTSRTFVISDVFMESGHEIVRF